MKDLTPQALRAAMRGGMKNWGSHGSCAQHIMYVEQHAKRRGRWPKCRCGCGQDAKFRAMANGVCMASGCELSMYRFIKRSV